MQRKKSFTVYHSFTAKAIMLLKVVWFERAHYYSLFRLVFFVFKKFGDEEIVDPNPAKKVLGMIFKIYREK